LDEFLIKPGGTIEGVLALAVSFSITGGSMALVGDSPLFFSKGFSEVDAWAVSGWFFPRCKIEVSS